MHHHLHRWLFLFRLAPHKDFSYYVWCDAAPYTYMLLTLWLKAQRLSLFIIKILILNGNWNVSFSLMEKEILLIFLFLLKRKSSIFKYSLQPSLGFYIVHSCSTSSVSSAMFLVSVLVLVWTIIVTGTWTLQTAVSQQLLKLGFHNINIFGFEYFPLLILYIGMEYIFWRLLNGSIRKREQNSFPWILQC